MAKKKIFLACASESKEVAIRIAQHLADNGYQPMRWWLEFPAGSITLDRLLEIAKEVDGAVFLCAGVDKIWYRQSETTNPRDNVILEYGIFLTRLGRRRTLVLTDEGTKLPSDLDGVSFLKLNDDPATAAERTLTHFNGVFLDPLPPTIETIPIVVDPAVVDEMTAENFPPRWHQRDLYIGIEGARGWLSVVNESDYAPQRHEHTLQSAILSAIEKVEARTFVSLGPGDADLDREIAIRLRQREPWLQYIPVDISDGLLQRSVKVLSEQVRVPVGILGDFEDRLNFIIRQLRTYATLPMMLALLGNTIGNLDKYETSFLQTISSSMRTADHLLLEVSLAGTKWAINDDRRAMHSGYGLANRRFIATALARRTHESVDSIVTSFEERIRFDVGASDVPDTRALNVMDSKTNRVILGIRRYNLDSLTMWLEKELKLEVIYSQAVYSDDIIGDGVVLLKCK